MPAAGPLCFNADLLGVSFNVFGSDRLAMVRTFGVAANQSTFPLQVQGMDVVSRGNNVRAFTVPEISWEPVLNTAPRVLPGDPQRCDKVWHNCLE